MQLKATIPTLEATIVETTLLQKELKADYVGAATCRQISVKDGKLDCVTPGSHVLWNGLGKMMFGADKDSFFNFLTLSYIPVDATLIGSTLISLVGGAYGVWMYTMVCK